MAAFTAGAALSPLNSARIFAEPAHIPSAIRFGVQPNALSGAPCAGPNQLKHKIEGLNTAGRFAQSAGLTVTYHNHWRELESKIDEIEALYPQTDPDLLHFVLDVAPAFKAMKEAVSS
jgi:hypothetical protein